ncbi:SH3 domain-containing protein [Streptomyces sp. MUM 203J]|uniref:SH3 domain-containing protein n=1 Tax=Streptomyces sp. MUM 203J TaxID=2791990 RepID=UPI001F039E48|nr:hypothetical protein [Streptomyces sp. MUM 203J]MCH0540246.1 SH3 domain-containing protein [Streptomyces sp. MUM 203J]
MRRNARTVLGLTTSAVALGLLGAVQAPVALATPPAPEPAVQPADAADETMAARPKHRKLHGKVIARTLNIRKEANTHSRIIGHFHKGDIVKIKCKVRGERVKGNKIWYVVKKQHRHGHHGLVSARWVKNFDKIPHCMD